MYDNIIKSIRGYSNGFSFHWFSFLVFTLYEPAKEGSKLQPNVAVILTL